MADKNLAYDFELFETSPKKEKREQGKKKNNLIKITEEQLLKSRRKKYNPFAVILGVFCSVIVLAIVGTMIYSQAQLTELTAQINAAQKSLAESESVNTQLNMRLESKMSLRSVEDYAKNKLGMRQTQSDQVVYIGLSDGDKAESKETAGEKSLVDRISDTISGLLS